MYRKWIHWNDDCFFLELTLNLSIYQVQTVLFFLQILLNLVDDVWKNIDEMAIHFISYLILWFYLRIIWTNRFFTFTFQIVNKIVEFNKRFQKTRIGARKMYKEEEMYILIYGDKEMDNSNNFMKQSKATNDYSANLLLIINTNAY